MSSEWARAMPYEQNADFNAIGRSSQSVYRNRHNHRIQECISISIRTSHHGHEQNTEGLLDVLGQRSTWDGNDGCYIVSITEDRLVPVMHEELSQRSFSVGPFGGGFELILLS